MFVYEQEACAVVCGVGSTVTSMEALEFIVAASSASSSSKGIKVMVNPMKRSAAAVQSSSSHTDVGIKTLLLWTRAMIMSSRASARIRYFAVEEKVKDFEIW